jgi:hypothetical protein
MPCIIFVTLRNPYNAGQNIHHSVYICCFISQRVLAIKYLLQTPEIMSLIIIFSITGIFFNIYGSLVL